MLCLLVYSKRTYTLWWNTSSKTNLTKKNSTAEHAIIVRLDIHRPGSSTMYVNSVGNKKKNTANKPRYKRGGGGRDDKQFTMNFMCYYIAYNSIVMNTRLRSTHFIFKCKISLGFHINLLTIIPMISHNEIIHFNK